MCLHVISSQASRACLCKSKMPNCLHIFSTEFVYPGEELNLSVVAVGQNFGTTSGYVHAQLLQGTANTSLGEHQHQCNILPYTIYSRRKKEILVLTATVTVIQDYGDNKTVQDSIIVYNESNRSHVPKDLLQFPVYVNVTLKKCPPLNSLIPLPTGVIVLTDSNTSRGSTK